ncbi:hypothetical protein ACS3SW_18870 [Roseobacteraceae bacterium S113]
MHWSATILVVVGLSGCGMLPAMKDDPNNSFDPQGVESRLSGKKLVSSDGTEFGLNKDGTFVGPNTRGRWNVSNGEFCRTIPTEVMPEPAVDDGADDTPAVPVIRQITTCDTPKFDGREVSFLGPDGSISTFEIQRGS